MCSFCYIIKKEIWEVITFEDDEVSEVKYVFYEELEKMVKERTEGFLNKYHKQIIVESNYMPGVKRILKMKLHTKIWS